MKKGTIVTAILIGMLCVGASASTIVTLEHGSNGVTVKEGHVRSSHVNYNFGGSLDLQVGGVPSGHASGQERFGFVEFNNIFGSGAGIVPLDQAVASATLRLYARTVTSHQTGNPVQDLFRVHPLSIDVTDNYGSKDGAQAATGEMCWSYKSWNSAGWGTGGTGNNGPVYGVDYRTDDYAGTVIHTDDDDQWIEWDVTTIVQAWHDNANSAGGYENLGLFLRNAGGGEPADTDDWVIPYFNTTNRTGGTDPELVVEYVPEPMTVALLGCAGLGLLRRRRN